MSHTLKTVIAVHLAFAAGVLFTLFVVKPPWSPVQQPVVNEEENLSPIALQEHEVLFTPAEPTSEPDEADMESSESIVAAPLEFFPPPSMDLTGPRLGRQKVPGSEDLGDVHQLYWHGPTAALYMAVTEEDGLRAVWRRNVQGKFERVFAANYGEGEIRIFGTDSGIIYVQHNNPARTYRTDDLFATWNTIDGIAGMFWGIADTGHGTVYGTLHDYNRAILYRSEDDGLTWEEWKDFHEIFPDDAVRYDPDDGRFRLRHLHDVIYSEKSDAIIVGTGDVARYTLESRDGGVTWRKIWDEGFTAHTPVGGGDRYLLGPDKLRGPGIALYDAWNDEIHEVFNPGDHGYAGYVYSMVNVDGIYYAAFHTESNEVAEIVPKFGIIVSPDAETWYPFLEWGPLGNHARTDIWLEPSPYGVFASVNGVLYAFSPLDSDWFAFHDPFPGEEKPSEAGSENE